MNIVAKSRLNTTGRVDTEFKRECNSFTKPNFTILDRITERYWEVGRDRQSMRRKSMTPEKTTTTRVRKGLRKKEHNIAH